MKTFVILALTALFASCVRAQADDGSSYNPIQCQSSDACLCPGQGEVTCVPDDGGSRFVNDNVCHCLNIPGGGVSGTGTECNPNKQNGPQRKMIDTAVPYNPILCSETSECGCTGQGEAVCSLCTDDTGSSNQFNKVCTCQNIPGGGASGTGLECNPLKTNGPKKSDTPIGCTRRRRRRRL